MVFTHLSFTRLLAVVLCALIGTAHAVEGIEAPVYPSFDCKAARSVAEQLICIWPEVARMDVQAAALYTQARSQSKDAKGLRAQQLQWLRERDQKCIAGASLAQAKNDEKVRACLAIAYQGRIFELRDLVVPPLLPANLVAVPGKALARIGLAQKGCSAMQGLWDDRGNTLALEIHCEQAGQGRRVWLIRRGTEVMPATPDLGGSDPHGETVFASGTDLYWDGDTLYVFTSLEGKETQPGAGSAWEPRYFTATMANGPTQIVAVPDRIQMFHGMRLGSFMGDDPEKLIADPDMAAGSAWLLGRRAVAGKGASPSVLQSTRALWLRALPEDRYALRVKNFEKGGAITEVARGGPELGQARFGNWTVIYPSPDGLLVHDLETGVTRRVAGTRHDDIPLAWAQLDAVYRLAWISTRPCGGMEGAAGQYLCMAGIHGVRQAGGTP